MNRTKERLDLLPPPDDKRMIRKFRQRNGIVGKIDSMQPEQISSLIKIIGRKKTGNRKNGGRKEENYVRSKSSKHNWNST